METGHKTRRKPDYITWVAVFLFLMIIFLELVLVMWLPVHLRTEGNWELQLARQEMIALEDNLRANFGDIAKTKTDMTLGEVELALTCLDGLARYLRENNDKMNIEQVVEVRESLRKFEVIYKRLRTDRTYTREGGLNPEKFFRKITTGDRRESAEVN